MSPLSEPGLDLFQPVLIDPADVGLHEQLTTLRAAAWGVHDTIEAQLLDLMEARNPPLRALPLVERRPLLAELAAAHLDGVPLTMWGRWVWYPWSGRLVHLLPPDDFRALRLDRNRDKLSAAELARLRTITVGVVGLSVGNAVALTLALEGGCGHLKLADFDTLELSNMSRVRAAVHEIGLPKTVLAARQIAEIDPYLPVTLFHEGLTAANVDAFLTDGPRVDILVDECDGIGVKYLLRERARAHRLPLLMETSDRGMLDVERFDQEPSRPSFHGLVPAVASIDLHALSTEERARHVLQIIGAETMSAELGASLIEVERTVATWPQLASDVVLGGASVTVAVRRIALGRPLESGRRFVDLERAIERPLEKPGPASTEGPAPRLDPAALDPVIAALLEEAATAPSGGNVQPWLFLVEGETIRLTLDPRRDGGLLDVDRAASLAALGAAAELLAIGAAARGLHAAITPFPAGEADIVARVDLRPGPGPEHATLAALHPLVRARCTNRRATLSDLLTEAECAALTAAAATRGGRVDWVVQRAALAALGDILGEGDRLRALNPALNADLAREMRFEPAAEAELGISLDTCELDALTRASFELVVRPDVAARVRALDGGARLGDLSRAALATCSGAGLLHLPDAAPATVFEGGRAMLRLWLAATDLGLGFQPVGTLPYMAALATRPGGPFDAAERARVLALDAALSARFPAVNGGMRLLLFRVHRGPPPSARSVRLGLAEVVAGGKTPPPVPPYSPRP